ncbi:MAG: C45 family autoproteolytic acyltransferase/hydrolase [Gemmataceae bacterium]|nr:phospholipase B family protein [Gemmata sp.]MDW8199197.1 C45 family autoproteolytic acyltransferase/hydrolase [Gemmataceae bacterium]
MRCGFFAGPFTLVLLVPLGLMPASEPVAIPAAHRPKATEVVTYKAGYRYPQAGWIVVHIEGEPYERGYQHGRLLAKEIAAHMRMLATERSVKAPADGWQSARQLANALLLRTIDREFLEEMTGIAEGATDAGASYDNRDIDLLDIVTLNCWMEIECLDAALAATPTGLEGMKFPRDGGPQAPAPQPVSPQRCSAFIATKPATADGQIVVGHITMAGLTSGPFVNVWLDVVPKNGHRFVMQGFPGAVWSSQDYYINAAGIVLCETTIDQTPFDIRGQSLVSRCRRAIQYGDSIDKVVKMLSEKNNGLYSNEWLIGDLKTNEIAMFELGTKTQRLWRSSRDEWFADTPGFYWGCNNAKDMAVRMEAQPADATDVRDGLAWKADERDKAWMAFYQQHKGKIDAPTARKALTDPALALPHSLDAKYTTANSAKQLATWAMYGPPTGKEWKPTPEQLQNHPEIQVLRPHPWTVLTIEPPPRKK